MDLSYANDPSDKLKEPGIVTCDRRGPDNIGRLLPSTCNRLDRLSAKQIPVSPAPQNRNERIGKGGSFHLQRTRWSCSYCSKRYL